MKARYKVDKHHKTPSEYLMFLRQQGLKINPDEQFVDKFLEKYNFFARSKHKKEIDRERAIFFIRVMCESIIYCLDFGYNVFIRGAIEFRQRISDYTNNTKYGGPLLRENVKKLTFKPVLKLIYMVKEKINKNNPEYTNYIKEKGERMQGIIGFYRSAKEGKNNA